MGSYGDVTTSEELNTCFIFPKFCGNICVVHVGKYTLQPFHLLQKFAANVVTRMSPEIPQQGACSCIAGGLIL